MVQAQPARHNMQERYFRPPTDYNGTVDLTVVAVSQDLHLEARLHLIHMH